MATASGVDWCLHCEENSLGRSATGRRQQPAQTHVDRRTIDHPARRTATCRWPERNWEENVLTKFATALLAITLSAGSVHAMTGRFWSHSLSSAHFPTCSEGLVKAICVCRAAHRSRLFELCRPGLYCHTFDGVCRQ